MKMRKSMTWAMLLVGVLAFPLSGMAMAKEKKYVTIEGTEYIRCQPVENYSGVASGATGNAEEWWAIIMSPAASWNLDECVARGNELIFKDLKPVKNAVCNNNVVDARKISGGVDTPPGPIEEEVDAVVTTTPLAIIDTDEQSITTNPDGGDNYTVSICGFELKYLEMYRHDKMASTKKFYEDDLEKRKKGSCYEISLPAGHGYNFKYVSSADESSQWLIFTGYDKESWQGNGTCTMPVVWGSASTKGAEIVACSDPLFKTLLKRSGEIKQEYENRGVLFIP